MENKSKYSLEFLIVVNYKVLQLGIITIHVFVTYRQTWYESSLFPNWYELSLDMSCRIFELIWVVAWYELSLDMSCRLIWVVAMPFERCNNSMCLSCEYETTVSEEHRKFVTWSIFAIMIVRVLKLLKPLKVFLSSFF